jgi:hypothetical protein
MRYLIIAILFISCNPLQKAMKQKEMIDAAIAQYVLDNPMPIDSVFIKGDEVVVYKDSIIRQVILDSLFSVDTIKITRYLDREVTRVDTLIRTVLNDSQVRGLMQRNNTLVGQLEAIRGDKKALIKFLVVVSIIALISSVIVLKNLLS